MDEDRIRDRAYAIWERDGRPEGRHEAHWAQARRELVEEERRPPPSMDLAGVGPDERLHPSGRNSGGV